MQMTPEAPSEPDKQQAELTSAELMQKASEWPGPGTEIVAYKPTQATSPYERPTSSTPVARAGPGSTPWQYNATTEGTLAVNKFNYYTVPMLDHTGEVRAAKHVHEHHHFAQGNPNYPGGRVTETFRYGRVGYFVQTGPSSYTQHPHPHPHTCPCHSEYPHGYPPQQMFPAPYSEVGAVDRHLHIHQHYYHSQYRPAQFQRPPPAGAPPRLVPQHQRFAPRSVHYSNRPYFAHHEGFQWFNRHASLHRAQYVPGEYDVSSLRDALGTM